MNGGPSVAASGMRWKWLPVLLLAVLATGCGATRKIKTLFSGALQMQIAIAPELNQNSALKVDLVVLYDKKLEQPLMELSARQWFGGRDQFERDHQRGFAICSWEWVPGPLNRIQPSSSDQQCAWQWLAEDLQPEPTLELEIKSGAETAFLFADYLSPGPHRALIDPRQHIVLQLGSKEFKIRPLE